jgi:Carboxypeptidase regulatory-like domain
LNPQDASQTRRPCCARPRAHQTAALALAASLLGAAAQLLAMQASETTQYLNGQVVDQRGDPIPGVACTLHGRILPQEGLSVNSDEQGHFAFPGVPLGTYSLTCVSMGFQSLEKTGIEVGKESPPVLKLTMFPEVVRQQVQVRAQAPSAADQGATPPAQLTPRAPGPASRRAKV